MNNRDYKEFTAGAIFHIYNRGNNKDNLFFDEQDYKAFLFRIGLALGFEEKELQKMNRLAMPYSRIRISAGNKNDFKLYSFCLMPNHFHLIIQQMADTSISKLISKICTSYAKYMNSKYKRVGHVFQDKFKAVSIENNPQLMWTASYIHMNPVKSSLTTKPEQYKWSSYIDYVSTNKPSIVEIKLISEIFGNKTNFIKETSQLGRDMSKTVFDR